MNGQMATNGQTTVPAVPRKAGRPKGARNKKGSVLHGMNIIDGEIKFTPFYGTVEGVQASELPRLRIEALGFGGRALKLLMDFVIGKEEGGQEAPASIRRLAALDILQIAGLSTTSQTIVKQTATNKPVAELDADELRALLASQKASLDQINQGLGRVVNEAEG